MFLINNKTALMQTCLCLKFFHFRENSNKYAHLQTVADSIFSVKIVKCVLVVVVVVVIGGEVSNPNDSVNSKPFHLHYYKIILNK